MSPGMRVCGGIVCGGRSSRMGQPKAWLPIGNTTMLAHITQIVGQIVRPVFVAAAPAMPLPALPEFVNIIYDRAEGRGPLNGLYEIMCAIGNQADAVYLSSCDVPFLNPRFIERVIASLGDYELCVPIAQSQKHPLAAVYRLSLLPAIEHQLGTGNARLSALTESGKARLLPEEAFADIDPELQSLRNLNSPEDYDRAMLQLARNPGSE